MKLVLIPSLTLLVATIAIACGFVWTGVAGNSADAADGYYITEFQRASR